MDEQEKLIKEITDRIEAANEGNLSNEEFKTFKAELTEKLKSVEGFDAQVKELDEAIKAIPDNSEDVESLKEELKEIENIVKELSKLVDRNNTAKGAENKEVLQRMTKKQKIKAILGHIFKSEEFESFEKSKFKGALDPVKLDDIDVDKATVSVTNNYTGTVLVAEVRDTVRDDTPMRSTHIREIMPQMPTEQATIVAPVVSGYDDSTTMGADMLGENDEAGESTFTTTEQTFSLKRIARALRISKRYFKTNGLRWVENYILQRLPDALQNVEDFQMLFGDGVGNNLNGLTRQAQQFNIAPTTFVATDFASVATFNGGTQALVTLAAEPSPKINNGDTIIIANATEATYNATHTNVIVKDAKSFVINVAYVAEADTSAWTGSHRDFWYQNVDNANVRDLVLAMAARLEAGEYSATGVVMHPNTLAEMATVKGTDGHYNLIVLDAAGRRTIAGLPLAVTTAMPAGHLLVGDFQRAVEVADFTPLSLQFAEDTETVKKNEIVVVAEEELIFPVYNPFWFMYTRVDDGLTQLETPA